MGQHGPDAAIEVRIAAYGWMLMQLIPEVTRQFRFDKTAMNNALSELVGKTFFEMATSLPAQSLASHEPASNAGKASNDKVLGELAASVSKLNGVAFQLALLQFNASKVAQNRQHDLHRQHRNW